MTESAEYDSESARARLLELLISDDCEWELSDCAENEGKPALERLIRRRPTRWDLVEYVISILRTDTILRCVPQGDPPGSTGTAWQMTDTNNMFVKLRICERRIGKEYVYIQSLHKSIHRQ